MRSPRAIAVTLLTGGVVALLAGCGGSSPRAAATTASQSPGAQAFAYARCIREHGVVNFPDPQVSTSPGQTSIKQIAPASVVNTPAFKSAQQACARLEPGPGNATSQSSGPPKQDVLAFAQCLRAHGITGFPDPNAQGRLTLEMVTAAGVDIHAPAFLPAARQCVGVTHGALTYAQVVAAVNNPNH